MWFYLVSICILIWYFKYERKREREKNKRKISGLIHDLKTPLTSIIGFTEFLRMSPRDEKDSEYLEVIEYEANRLLRMMSEIIAGKEELEKNGEANMIKRLYRIFSNRVKKPDIKKEITENQQTNCSESLASICKSFVPSAEKRGIKIKTEIENDVFIAIDENQFWRVASNIIENAVKYNKDGGEIAVSATVEGNLMKIKISDNGIGIDEKNIANIFKRGFRENEDSKTKGFGIGLSSIKEILSFCGGKINVESTKGKGSTFTIWLPIKKRD
jgi:signal transduction histidine kinase